MKVDARTIVKRALTTEKSLNLREGMHCYAFEVNADANRLEIGRAIEALFKVKVTNVRTVNVRGKLKRLGRFAGKRAAWKKAYVTIGPDGHIDLFEKAYFEDLGYEYGRHIIQTNFCGYPSSDCSDV